MMTIRETNRFCRGCGREMEFVPKGVAEHEFLGQYVCGCCGHQEYGSYCEMVFFSIEEMRAWKAQDRQGLSPDMSGKPPMDLMPNGGEARAAIGSEKVTG